MDKELSEGMRKELIELLYSTIGEFSIYITLSRKTLKDTREWIRLEKDESRKESFIRTAENLEEGISLSMNSVSKLDDIAIILKKRQETQEEVEVLLGWYQDVKPHLGEE